MSPAEVAELLGLLGALPADDRFAPLLCERCQGNPFFIRQLLQLLQQCGQPLEAMQLEAAELPPAVRDVIAQRLVGFSAEARAALSSASVIGQSFDAPVLAELRNANLTRVLSELEPALALGLVQAQPATAHRFVFAHALLRDALYDELGLVERGQLHARLWHSLAAQPSCADPERLASSLDTLCWRYRPSSSCASRIASVPPRPRVKLRVSKSRPSSCRARSTNSPPRAAGRRWSASCWWISSASISSAPRTSAKPCAHCSAARAWRAN